MKEIKDFKEDLDWSEVAIPYCTQLMGDYFKRSKKVKFQKKSEKQEENQ